MQYVRWQSRRDTLSAPGILDLQSKLEHMPKADMEWQIFEGGEKKMENAKAWKKKWEYNYQKGLRGAMISVDAVEQDEK